MFTNDAYHFRTSLSVMPFILSQKNVSTIMRNILNIDLTQYNFKLVYDFTSLIIINLVVFVFTYLVISLLST